MRFAPGEKNRKPFDQENKKNQRLVEKPRIFLPEIKKGERKNKKTEASKYIFQEVFKSLKYFPRGFKKLKIISKKFETR